MKQTPCRRLWQVEAAHDGRLVGSDLSNALRHRSECPDCSQAARALSELGRELKELPVRSTDPLRQRRTRQALLGAWNEHLLAERPRSRVSPRVALTLAFCGIAAIALAIGYPRVKRTPQLAGPAPVRPNAATEGQPKAPELTPAVPSALPVARPESPATEPARAILHASSTPAKSRIAVPERTRATAQPATDTAEDDAYLQIVALLRAGRELDARAKAAEYLVLFPNGFRRPEVEGIAQRRLLNK